MSNLDPDDGGLGGGGKCIPITVNISSSPVFVNTPFTCTVNIGKNVSNPCPTPQIILSCIPSTGVSCPTMPLTPVQNGSGEWIITATITVTTLPYPPLLTIIAENPNVPASKKALSVTVAPATP